MLQTKHKANDVVTLKLVSGEEVIGYYVSEDMGGVTLRKPVVPVPTAEGNMALAPYIMSSNYLREADGQVIFNKQTVITVLATDEQFKNAFTQQVSGLDLAPGTASKLIA